VIAKNRLWINMIPGFVGRVLVYEKLKMIMINKEEDRDSQKVETLKVKI
jgi:hypothetical protein